MIRFFSQEVASYHYGNRVSGDYRLKNLPAIVEHHLGDCGKIWCQNRDEGSIVGCWIPLDRTIIILEKYRTVSRKCQGIAVWTRAMGELISVKQIQL